MELYVYDREMTLQGIVEKITSLIWTRRYWSCGEFKLLVPFTEEHAKMLVKNNIILKRGSEEAAEIRYISITKNSQGLEEIEVQGKFLLSWIGKRIIKTQIVRNDTTQSILYAIVRQTCTEAGAVRSIPNFSIATDDPDTESGVIEYASEKFSNALLAAETAAKAAKLGIRVKTNPRTGEHIFSVYEGRNLTADNAAGNAPCIFSQEFDNIVEQDYTNSIENLKSTAYVGGEEKEGSPRKVAEVGGTASALDRDEVFINATDITQEYEDENDNTIVLSDADYLALLAARGAEELSNYAETLAFGSKINTNANLKYREDYDLGDRVTCVNKRWGVRIDVRITEIAETYEARGDAINITFGESLPALLTQIRQITK
ncbi:siphovirus ReqiPepy6 Gp37-like family protein [Eubacteriales bacterium OttesenSCG-928-N13]|nr:siphovirus ReqiPepy6 Gp37-like family protein [Eubacteriales bacterium OttesenSCG-928-N13]